MAIIFLYCAICLLRKRSSQLALLRTFNSPPQEGERIRCSASAGMDAGIEPPSSEKLLFGSSGLTSRGNQEAASRALALAYTEPKSPRGEKFRGLFFILDKLSSPDIILPDFAPCPLILSVGPQQVRSPAPLRPIGALLHTHDLICSCRVRTSYAPGFLCGANWKCFR